MVSGTLDYWLRQGTALRSIYERAEPNLLFTQFVEPIPETDISFIYGYDDTGMSADALKEEPGDVEVGGDFPEIDISQLKYTPGLIETKGFQVRIPYLTMRNAPRGISQVQKAYKIAAFWFADYLNTNIATAICAGATTPTWTPPGLWSATDGTATPILDEINFKNSMKREGYYYRMTDMFVHMNNFNEMETFLTGSEIASWQNAASNAMQDSLVLPIESKPVLHGCFSGITDGYQLGLDKNNPCAEFHYFVDPQFGTAQVNYQTIIGGNKQTAPALNLGLMYRTYQEQKSMDQILVFWNESKTVVTQPYAAQYDNGI